MPDDVTLVVPQRADGGFTHGTIATTSRDLPDIAVKAMPIWQIILIRAAKAYLNAFLAFATAQAVGAEHMGLSATHNLFLAAAELAVYPAALALLTNVGMLLTRLDEQVPSSWHA